MNFLYFFLGVQGYWSERQIGVCVYVCQATGPVLQKVACLMEQIISLAWPWENAGAKIRNKWLTSRNNTLFAFAAQRSIGADLYLAPLTKTPISKKHSCIVYTLLWRFNRMDWLSKQCSRCAVALRVQNEIKTPPLHHITG